MPPRREPGGRNTPSHSGSEQGGRVRWACQLKVRTAHATVMGRLVVFGKIIGAVGGTALPENIKLFLFTTVTQPPPAHIKGFGTLEADLGGKDAVSSRVVGFKGNTGSRLRMTHFGESGDDGDSFLGVEEETADLGFRSGGSDSSKCFAENMERAVADGSRRVAGGGCQGGEIEMSCRTAASIGQDEIGGVGADGQDHVAGMIANGGEGMGTEVVEQHGASGTSFFGGCSLLVRNFVESDNDGGVSAARIVEKRTGDLLDAVNTGLVEKGRQVGRGKLHFLAIDGSCPEMWGMLRSEGRRMAQGEHGFGNIVGHGEIDKAGGVVPIESETTV